MAGAAKKTKIAERNEERQNLIKKTQKSVLPKVLLLLVLLFAALSFAFFLNQEEEYRRQQKLNAQYTETLNSLMAENERLDDAKKNINSPDNIAKIAHDQGMIREGEVIFEDGAGN